MKMTLKILPVLALLFGTTTLIAQNEEPRIVRSKLNDATIFFMGAELTHTTSVNLVKGNNFINIEGLSPTIDKNSLKVKTSAGVFVSSFELSVDYLSDAKKTNLYAKKLQDSVDIYTSKISKLSIEMKVNSDLIKMLKDGIDKNVSNSENGLGIDDLIKTMDYYKTKSAELQATKTTLDKQYAEANKSLQKLQQQLRQEVSENSKPSGILKLNLSSPLTTTCNLTISYYTTSAKWTPFYDINIASANTPIQIVTKAKVSQTTGLDWDKVKLTLSTAMPSNGKIAPLFSTWFLKEKMQDTRFKNKINSSLQGMVPGVAVQNAYSYEKETSFIIQEATTEDEHLSPIYVVNGEVMSDEQFNQIDTESIKEIHEISPGAAESSYGQQAANGAFIVTLKDNSDYISMSDNQMNMTFNIDLPYSVPGNGKEQVLELKSQQTDATYKYYCAPRLDTETYLLAEISDWQKLNLLNGKANITYEGTYVGESEIQASSTMRNLTLTLGSDKRISVKREKMRDFSSTKFLGNDVKQVFSYKLTVRNNQNKAVKMVLKDQYPISTQKNIEVELLKETTPYTANKEETGVITWEEELQPGQTKEYIVSYSVKYPKGMDLNL